jgi:hypothetical protein
MITTKQLDRLEKSAIQYGQRRVKAFRHPHFNRLKYFQNRVGLSRALELAELEWLNNNTTGQYSIDFTIAPHNLSFEMEADALLFKLTFGGELAVAKHIKY